MQRSIYFPNTNATHPPIKSQLRNTLERENQCAASQTSKRHKVNGRQESLEADHKDPQNP
jgi:hypothetical protein